MSKPTLLFLHGFLEDKTIWSDFEKHFSKNYSVLCLDLLGHGTGLIPENGNYSMVNMATVVHAELAKKNIQKTIIIGHSMGGYVALEFAEMYPEMVIGISLFHSTAVEDSEERKINRTRAIQIIKKNKKIFTESVIPKLFFEPNIPKFKNEIKTMQKIASKISNDSIIGCLQGMRERTSSIHFIKNTTIPIQYIIGQQDSIINYASLNNQINIKPNFKITILENCGHMGFLEAKTACLQAITQFITQLIFVKYLPHPQ